MLSFKKRLSRIINSIPFIGQKRVGLVLGSGSARGLAHLGVLNVLKEAGVEIEFVAGTSVGALVGAFFAAGKIDKLMKFMESLTSWESLKFADFVIPNSGLIEGKKIERFLRDNLGYTKIEDLNIPFACVTVDYYTGAEVVLKSGDLVDAVRASISIPGIFKPIPVNRMLLVDGGLVNPVPVGVVRELGAEYIIAVDICPRISNVKISSDLIDNSLTGQRVFSKTRFGRKNSKFPPNIFEVIFGSISIMEASISEMRMKNEKPDVIIKPDIFDVGLFEFHRYKLGVFRGEQAAKGVLKKIDRFVRRKERMLINRAS